MTTSKPIGFSFAILLGLITVLGPAGTDMYLPSLPQMANELNTSYANIQSSLMVFLLAMGFGQLIFGPLSDSLGRKKPLVFGTLLYLSMSLLAANSDSVNQLLLCRFFQGLAASMTLVVVMSMIRDVTNGLKAAQLFAMLMTIEGLVLVLAPTIGGFVDVVWGWRGVMYVLALLALSSLFTALFLLPESLPADKRLPMNLSSIVSNYVSIMRDKAFLLPALALSATFFYLFLYIGGVSHAYQSGYGLSAEVVGIVLGGTGGAILLGSIISAKWVDKFGLAPLAVSGTFLLMFGALIALVGHLCGLGLSLIVLGMFVAMTGFGLAETCLMSLAMLSQDKALGATAALLGSLKLILASIATPIAGVLVESSVSYWLAFMLIFGAVVLFLGIKSAQPVARKQAAAAA